MSETDNQIFCKCGSGSFYVRKNESIRLICTKCKETLKVSVGFDVIVNIKE